MTKICQFHEISQWSWWIGYATRGTVKAWESCNRSMRRAFLDLDDGDNTTSQHWVVHEQQWILLGYVCNILIRKQTARLKAETKRVFMLLSTIIPCWNLYDQLKFLAERRSVFVKGFKNKTRKSNNFNNRTHMFIIRTWGAQLGDIAIDLMPGQHQQFVDC